MHIFNDTYLASKPHVIKTLPKSNMAVIWINIWDAQSGAKTKCLINRYFNISSYIAIVRGANMNPNISSIKIAGSEDTTFAYHAQSSRCVKYNELYKVEHHRHFT